MVLSLIEAKFEIVLNSFFKNIGLFAKILPGKIFFRPPGGENYQLSIFLQVSDNIFNPNIRFM